MRRWVLAAALASAAACTPVVESESYYCGPEELCPPDQVCRETDNVCVLPGDFVPFACTDDDMLGAATCPPATLVAKGCVLTGDGVHAYPLTTGAGCAVHLSVSLSYPVAFMPVAVSLRDASGTVVATSAPCSTSGGSETACLEADPQPGVAYTLEVAAAPGAPTCDGAGAFNRYLLSVAILHP